MLAGLRVLLVAVGVLVPTAAVWGTAAAVDMPPLPLTAAATEVATAESLPPVSSGTVALRTAVQPAAAAQDPGWSASGSPSAEDMDPQRFLREFHGVLAGASAAAEKLAALRRARRVVPEGWPDLFAMAIDEPHCNEAAASGDTPAEFALQQLIRGSASNAMARRALGLVVFESATAPLRLRERAARAFAATSPAHEAEWLFGRVDQCREPLVRAALREGLAELEGR